MIYDYWFLKSHGLEFSVQISEVQSVIEQQKGNHGTKQRLKSWSERYHQLNEVGS